MHTRASERAAPEEKKSQDWGRGGEGGMQERLRAALVAVGFTDEVLLLCI